MSTKTGQLQERTGRRREKQGSADLYCLASRIPSMGGTSLGPLLRHLARSAPEKSSIVEVGCWLGAGTAQLALGIGERESPDAVSLHCYDRWTANRQEVEKAARAGVELLPGQDILPLTRKALDPFGVPIRYHKSDIRDAHWDGGPISVYVDDASKRPPLFYHSLLTFAPSWVPGQTVVVLMDYHIWKKTGETGHECQKQLVEANAGCFEPMEIETAGHASSCPVFLYKAPLVQEWVAVASAGIERRRRALSERVEKREREIRRLQNSISWRITAPLRGAADGFRRLSRAGGRGRTPPP